MSSKAKKTKYLLGRTSTLSALKTHPFVIFISIFLVLFFLTLVSFIALGGQTIGPSDSRIVRLIVDGQGQTVPTRAKTVAQLLERLAIDVGSGDLVEPPLEAEITEGGFQVNVYRSRSVLIDDDGKKTVLVTAEPTPERIAQSANLTLSPYDKIDKVAVDVIEPVNAIQSGVVAEKVVIDRARLVKLSLYGTMYDVYTRVSNVGQLVAERGIDPNKSTVFPSPDSPLTEGGVVFVTQPGKQITTVEETIAFKEEFVNDMSLPMGTSKIKETGRLGKKVVVYEIAEDGKTKKALQEIVVAQPINKLTARGSQVIISNPSENVRLGEQMAAQRGWTGEQWFCLYSLWQRESGWSTTAGNRTTGAYGIPQALPGSKMGSGWQSDPAVQINWGLGYIAGRYGTPCGAWQYFQLKNWY